MTHIKRDGKYWCGSKISANPRIARATGTISLTRAIKKNMTWLCPKCQEKLNTYLKNNLVVSYE